MDPPLAIEEHPSLFLKLRAVLQSYWWLATGFAAQQAYSKGVAGEEAERQPIH